MNPVFYITRTGWRCRAPASGVGDQRTTVILIPQF